MGDMNFLFKDKWIVEFIGYMNCNIFHIFMLN
jgi:hypothetical protein